MISAASRGGNIPSSDLNSFWLSKHLMRSQISQACGLWHRQYCRLGWRCRTQTATNPQFDCRSCSGPSGWILIFPFETGWAYELTWSLISIYSYRSHRLQPALIMIPKVLADNQILGWSQRGRGYLVKGLAMIGLLKEGLYNGCNNFGTR